MLVWHTRMHCQDSQTNKVEADAGDAGYNIFHRLPLETLGNHRFPCSSSMTDDGTLNVVGISTASRPIDTGPSHRLALCIDDITATSGKGSIWPFRGSIACSSRKKRAGVGLLVSKLQSMSCRRGEYNARSDDRAKMHLEPGETMPGRGTILQFYPRHGEHVTLFIYSFVGIREQASAPLSRKRCSLQDVPPTKCVDYLHVLILPSFRGQTL